LKRTIAASLIAVCITLVSATVVFAALTSMGTNPASLPLDESEFVTLFSMESPSSPPLGAIIVPDDCVVIQQAVDQASEEGIVFVRKGQYNESVTVNKALWLIGEGRQSTIIDANSLSPSLLINHDNVNVTGFFVMNTPTPSKGSFMDHMMGIGLPVQLPGIEIQNASHCNIYGNNILGSLVGVTVERSTQNNIVENEIKDNSYGIKMDSSANNYVVNNVIMGGSGGVQVELSVDNNILYNTIKDTSSAIWLHFAAENTFRGNKLVNNSFSILESRERRYPTLSIMLTLQTR
jgi:parallel beta-helix repeat protein